MGVCTSRECEVVLAAAGQGYIWLAHRDPHSAVWPLAVQSKQMWQDWLCEGTPSESDVEWQASGSILLGTDAAQLADRQRLLESAVIHAELWDAGHLHAEEPALAPSVTSGLFVSSDSQLVRVQVWCCKRTCLIAMPISSCADARPGSEWQGCCQGAAGSV